MSGTSGRACPVCSHAKTPVYRALCGGCWALLPHELRIRHQSAWRHRVRDPNAYGESLIALFQWRRDKGGIGGGSAA